MYSQRGTGGTHFFLTLPFLFGKSSLEIRNSEYRIIIITQKVNSNVLFKKNYWLRYCYVDFNNYLNSIVINIYHAFLEIKINTHTGIQFFTLC